MHKSQKNTLKREKSATGTSDDAAYVKELEDILAQFQNADDSVTKWLKEYLGMEYTITFYFEFCPEGMSNVPPTPFYIKVELEIEINPYKILDEMFDGAEVIEKTLSDRKSTRLNSSHRCISYAVFCLKKKNITLKLN